MGQLGLSAVNPLSTKESVLSSIKDPTMVSASEKHVLALTQNGTIYGWGDNSALEVNNSGKVEILSPFRIGQFAGVKKVAAGDRFSLYLTKTGEVYGWGDLRWLGISKVSADPARLTMLSEVISDIQVYDRTIVALGQSGSVYLLGDGFLSEQNSAFQKIESSSKFKAVTVGYFAAYALKDDGTVWSFPTNLNQKAPKVLRQLVGFKDIIALSAEKMNDDYVVAIDKNNQIWGWGDRFIKDLMKYEKNFTFHSNTPINITKRILTSNHVLATGTYKWKSISTGGGAVFLTSSNKAMVLASTFFHSEQVDDVITSIEINHSNAASLFVSK